MSSSSCFNGDFRNKPNQSFGGVNRNVCRDQFIHQIYEERKMRENTRKNSEAAIKMQARFRQSRCQKRWFGMLRAEFDLQRLKINDEPPDINEIHYLGLRLIHFYRYDDDICRLVYLNRILCGISIVIRRELMERFHWIKRIFEFNAAGLVQCFDNLQKYFDRFELFIRTFDLYLSDDDAVCQTKIKRIWNHILGSGYMNHLKVSLNKLHKHPEYGDFRHYLNVLLKKVLDSRSPPERFVECLLEQLLPGLEFDLMNNMLDHWCMQRPAALSRTDVMEAFGRIDFNPDKPHNIYLATVYCVTKLVMPQANETFSDTLQKQFFSMLKDFAKKISEQFDAKPTSLEICLRGGVQSRDNGDDDSDTEINVSGPELTRAQIDSPDHQVAFYLQKLFGILNSEEYCNMFVQYLECEQKSDSDRHQGLMALCHIGHLMVILHGPVVHRNRLVLSLAFSPKTLKQLWYLLETQPRLHDDWKDDPDTFGSLNFMKALAAPGGLHLSIYWREYLAPFSMFCALFIYFLETLDDMAFSNLYQSECDPNRSSKTVMPFTMNQMVDMCAILRDVGISLIEMSFKGLYNAENLKSILTVNFPSSLPRLSTYDIQCWNVFQMNLMKLLRHLHARDIRLSFCPENHWVSKRVSFATLPENYMWAEITCNKITKEYCELPGPNLLNVINVALLREMPFVVPFKKRVELLRKLIGAEQNNDFPFYRPIINIRRRFIYEDTFYELSQLQSGFFMKKGFRIQFISPLGLPEIGIDGGGIFREFLYEALKAGTDPARGLFTTTPDGYLYPNNGISLFDDFGRDYFLLGQLLGKAIYDGILLDLPIAKFFLAKFEPSNCNCNVDINFLSTMDPELYKNLFSLKNYSGDIAKMELNFTTVVTNFGMSKEVELKPNGSKISVTNSNKIEYVHLKADYLINRQVQQQSIQFKKGLYTVLDPLWINLFDPKEFQILISGKPGPIDLDDLIRHVTYSQDYEPGKPDHEVIKIFWEVVSEFDGDQQRKLLKFVTSSSQPPLLGFKDLLPPFCIQSAPPDLFPASSTCANVLKLPKILDKDLMRKKLYYSINSESGFELA